LPKSEKDMPKATADLGYDILPLAGAKSYTLYRGKGCNECTNGYKGRSGIYEVFGMSDSVEKLLVARASTSEIQAQAQRDGMVTMRQDGYLKALNGVTTTSEVARVAAEV
jgi:type II secretory ATPase GspE/PulE/Tfp pilus assembly ATPase PilB-like protein